MKIQHFEETPAEPVEVGAGASIRWVISRGDGAPNFSMRVIEVEPGGSTPKHAHAWEHEVFVLAGRGVIRNDQGEHPIEHGSVVFVAPNELHQFANTGPEPLRFICVVPNR